MRVVIYWSKKTVASELLFMCVQVIYNLLLGLNKTCWVRAKSRLKKCVGHAIKLKCEIVSYAKWQKITRGKSSLAQEALYCVCNKLKKHVRLLTRII